MKNIALTFDDGPDKFTDRILDLLQKYNFKATFFVQGNKIASQPETVIKAAKLGNEIGNHTWTHARISELSAEDAEKELRQSHNEIKAAIGQPPVIMRPTFGDAREPLPSIARNFGYPLINWTVDPMDWEENSTAERIFSTITAALKAGDIILLHDPQPATAQAIEQLIPWFAENGFNLVTVSELLPEFFEPPQPGKLYGTTVV
ncbi:MAG: polysaccharide deacetylase family protein [Defluviitaleaceae bacterium]|nr:polysaccharide deacetylase family protein [Defluviitaleaceae bacterium]